MNSNKVTDVENLDFEKIKAKLKLYLSSQDEFTDYDFEGSGINVLIDLLSHNTHYNALLAHLNMNETFLDTAQVRSNVVSHAQNIGYVPKSKSSANTNIDIVVQGGVADPTSITMPRGTRFSGKINNEVYTFNAIDNSVASKLNDNSYKFFNVSVFEGSIREEKFRRDGAIPFQRYEMKSSDIDTKTIRVTVFENPNTNESEEYQYFGNIVDVTSRSPVYFLRENNFGRYEIWFGDDFIGRLPPAGSHVVVQYIETIGAEANNINLMSPSGSIQGLSDISVSFSEGYNRTSGGSEQESIDSVKHNGPINYSIQNRAVTAGDYKQLILNEFNNIKDVSVWGGEDADPVQYGKVFIAPALFDQSNITESLSGSIRQFLKTKNVGAITPEIVASEYNYINIDCRFKYNIKNTNRTKFDIETLVAETIADYSNNELSSFDGVLRYSKLLRAVDDVDSAIENSIVYMTMYKKLKPNPLSSVAYTLDYPTEIFKTSEVDEFVVYSSQFIIDGVVAEIRDEPMLDGTKNRKLYIINASTGLKISKYSDIGYADVIKGKVFLNSIRFDTSNLIDIYIRPDAYDIAPKFNQIITIQSSDIKVTGFVDTIAAYSLAGVSSYESFSVNGS